MNEWDNEGTSERANDFLQGKSTRKWMNDPVSAHNEMNKLLLKLGSRIIRWSGDCMSEGMKERLQRRTNGRVAQELVQVIV